MIFIVAALLIIPVSAYLLMGIEYILTTEFNQVAEDAGFKLVRK